MAYTLFLYFGWACIGFGVLRIIGVGLQAISSRPSKYH